MIPTAADVMADAGAVRLVLVGVDEDGALVGLAATVHDALADESVTTADRAALAALRLAADALATRLAAHQS